MNTYIHEITEHIFRGLNCSISKYPDGNTVKYLGSDAFDYYWGMLSYYWESKLASFMHFPWQVQTAFTLTIACIIVMIFVALRFFRKKRELKEFQEELKEVNEKYRQHFWNILISADTYTFEMIEEECGATADDFAKISPDVLATVISEIRLELSELTFVINIDILCEVTGVKQFYESNLVNRRDQLSTLQNLVTMTLRISEGYLATYINHHNSNIRHLARMSYIVCTKAEPYRYLEEDLQEKQALWRPMMLHRLFGWLRDTERQMPQFLVLAGVMKDPQTAAFLIEEIAYWGNDTEKASINTFFLSPMFKCREAALKAVTFLHDDRHEQAIIDSYPNQPEYLQRECLRAIHSIGSGRHTEFFVESYYNTSSKETRECALTCLYSYGAEGRRRFETMREDISSDEQGLRLLDQIDSLAVLQQLRAC